MNTCMNPPGSKCCRAVHYRIQGFSIMLFWAKNWRSKLSVSKILRSILITNVVKIIVAIGRVTICPNLKESHLIKILLRYFCHDYFGGKSHLLIYICGSLQKYPVW